jgi:hypothetical protein
MRMPDRKKWQERRRLPGDWRSDALKADLGKNILKGLDRA